LGERDKEKEEAIESGERRGGERGRKGEGREEKERGRKEGRK
jgi:hypothetical protein